MSWQVKVDTESKSSPVPALLFIDVTGKCGGGGHTQVSGRGERQVYGSTLKSKQGDAQHFAVSSSIMTV